MTNMVPWSSRDETQGDDGVGIAGEEDVTGELLLHEAGVRLVVVEGADHVVAVGPRVRAHAVLVVAVRLRKVDGVKPVPRPTLAVARRREQAIDGFFVGERVATLHTCINVLW